ncbi:hypothetical protein R5R35_001041 [Gryllus longicercus]|uniref:DUF4789 domain-containing protein n=1 Tax=Gryllus longicercus TaxID=2509291 RepID=A0AAN9V8H0_9ORTH
MQRLLCLLCTALAAGRAAVVAPVTPHGPPNTPAVVTSAAYLSTETDVLDTPGWMRALFGVHFDEEERRCAAKDEVLYRPLRQCFVLFRRGPCARKEWLVFDKQKAARGVLTVVCAPRRCAPDWGYDAASGTCFRHSKCAAPLAFHYTLFGEGVCRCNGTTGGLINAPPDDPASCHELYRHAPCRKGQMLAPRYRLIEGMDAMCFRDPCDGYRPPPAENASAPITTTATTTTTAATTAAPLVKGRPTHGDRAPHDHHPDHRVGHPPFGWPTTPEPDVRPVWRSLAKGGAASPVPAGRNEFPDPPGEGDEEFDVEVIGGPTRPNLGVRTSTRAVIGSNNNNNKNNKESAVPHDHRRWPDPEHGDSSSHEHYFREHDHDQGHFHGQESTQRKYAFNFTITLKPLPQAGARRARRQVWSDTRTTRNARGEPNSRVGSAAGGLKHGPRGPPYAEPDAALRGNRFEDEAAAAARDPQGSSGAANVTDDYALEVQYSDGNRSCMSPSQLNVVCDLQMVPLFSDFSDVKVPICVNALFRFAIGRVGKSDECAENDKGECATKVVVKSAEPLDWELE